MPPKNNICSGKGLSQRSKPTKCPFPTLVPSLFFPPLSSPPPPPPPFSLFFSRRMGDFFETLAEYSKKKYGEDFFRLVDDTISQGHELTQWRLRICEQFEKHLDPVAQAMGHAHHKDKDKVFPFPFFFFFLFVLLLLLLFFYYFLFFIFFFNLALLFLQDYNHTKINSAVASLCDSIIKICKKSSTSDKRPSPSLISSHSSSSITSEPITRNLLKNEVLMKLKGKRAGVWEGAGGGGDRIIFAEPPSPDAIEWAGVFYVCFSFFYLF